MRVFQFDLDRLTAHLDLGTRSGRGSAAMIELILGAAAPEVSDRAAEAHFGRGGRSGGGGGGGPEELFEELVTPFVRIRQLAGAATATLPTRGSLRFNDDGVEAEREHGEQIYSLSVICSPCFVAVESTVCFNSFAPVSS